MQEIMNACECGVYLESNRHRDYYDSIETAIAELKDNVDQETKDRMLKANTIISLQFYPSTPVGFYVVYGTTVDEVITKAKSILEI